LHLAYYVRARRQRTRHIEPYPVLEIDPVTVSGVMEAIPCTLMTSADAVPAVPIAGCLAAVAAPVGSETVPAMLFMFPVPAWLVCGDNHAGTAGLLQLRVQRP